MGFMATPCIAHASFALGCARRALDEWRNFAGAKQRAPGLVASGLHTFQRDFAAAEADLRAAEAYVRRTFDQLFAAAEAGAVPDDLRIDGRLAACNAFAAGMRVVQAAYSSATTTALRNGSAIQRCFRDMNAGNAHFLTGEATLIELGKVLGGVEGAQLVF
jgi:alkylation response protein AidB-like acyl-CoA dehydrogenase